MKNLNIEIPDELIAQHPLKNRSECKMICLDRKAGSINHKKFTDILSYIKKNDLLVLNDTRVIKARFFAKKITGGNVEVLLLKPLNNKGLWAALLRGKNIVSGTCLLITEMNESIIVAEVGSSDAVFTLDFGSESKVFKIIETVGKIPLPPYIKRDADQDDATDYQTVFAKNNGSVASPTASLHFTKELLQSLKDRGVKIAYVTLHVGYGTFSMIKDIETHKMHSEYYSIPDDTIMEIQKCKSSGSKVWAVGTTVIRTLETAFDDRLHCLKQEGYTDLFIKDSYKFKVVDSVITNFHHPKTSLILLVSAFAGPAFIEKAYNEAIQNRYRFLSYGDSMLII